MKHWTTQRLISFYVHLAYVLIPAVAALIAAVNLWSFIFGGWYFAVPLILCLEGVAALGFVFHLKKLDSPFVYARHFIPLFSVATLAYELGVYLVGMHGVELGVPVTAFVVLVFGTLFVKSFGVIERLFIDPVQAVREKALAQVQAILLPIHEHEARQEVYDEVATRLKALRAPVEVPSITAVSNPHIGSTLDEFISELPPEEQRAINETAVLRREEYLRSLSPQELMALPDTPEVLAEIERRVSKNAERLVNQGVAWLQEQGIIGTREAPDEGEQPVEPVATVSAAQGEFPRCAKCGGETNQSDLGVCSKPGKWKVRSAQEGGPICKPCRHAWGS